MDMYTMGTRFQLINAMDYVIQDGHQLSIQQQPCPALSSSLVAPLYHEHPEKRKILGFYNVRDPVADGLVHRNVRYVHRRRLIYRTCRLSPSLGKSEAYVAGSHNLRSGLQWLTTDV
jgi:hypothetical protein